jgi:ribosomal protein S18 acetylase RimI-like enzyme
MTCSHQSRRRFYRFIFIYFVGLLGTVHSWSSSSRTVLGHGCRTTTPSIRQLQTVTVTLLHPCRHCPPSPLLLSLSSSQRTTDLLLNKDRNHKKNRTKQDFFIRKSMALDVGRASQILTDGFFKRRGMNIFSYFLERLETYLSLEVDFPKPLTRHEIFVACDACSGQVLGMAEVDARTTGRSACGQDGPYMCNLAVDEARQRKGIASALVQYCELQVQQWHYETMEDDVEVANSLYLKVRETNQAAVSMYDKLGYRSYRQEKDNKGTTVLVMRKELPKVANVSQQQQSQDQEKNQVEKERKRNTQVYS